MRIKMPTVSDYIIETVYSLGVDTVFGVVGGNCLYLADAIARHKHMRFVPMHGEQAAGYAAIGYAKQKNHLGVVLVTTGCGSTNVITPLLSAWQDSVPLIVLAGEVPTTMSTETGRQKGTQEADVWGMARSIVKAGKWDWKLPYLLPGHISIALRHRRGPVWISVPLDVSSSEMVLGSRAGSKPLERL